MVGPDFPDADRKQSLKKYAVTLLKYGIPLIIILWLLDRDDFVQASSILRQRKNWLPLAAGFCLAFAATMISFVRWHLLVRALDLPFRLADAFRLGFLGHLLTFVSGGNVGGDLFKAVFVAHEHPGRRAEAVATVLVDRIVGMMALLLITSTAILLAAPAQAAPVVRGICEATLLATALGVILLAAVLVPRHPSQWLLATITRVPKLGETLRGFVGSAGVYRRKPGVLLLTLGISVFTHLLFVLSLSLVAVSVLDTAPSVGEQAIIVPLSMVAGALPLTPGGLGTFELAMDQLYRLLPAVPTADGILVALAYRLMTVLIAVIGLVYYWSSRREVAELMDEAEHPPDELPLEALERKGELQPALCTVNVKKRRLRK
jgi:glycosyltransferase 2 family protein